MFGLFLTENTPSLSGWEKFTEDFYDNFIQDERWKYLTEGLFNTLKITLIALVIGVFLGFIIALCRVWFDAPAHDKQKPLLQRLIPLILNGLAKLYLTVMRGTPVVVQLMIIYFVILAWVPSEYSIWVAGLAFGLNSGAYVAEIFRAGLMSIDIGQTEAGRSLGLSSRQTMWRILMPQAIKNVLPALANEMITLLKETSVAGYIAIQDLTKAADTIRSRTYSPLLPLLAIALIYLLIVMGITFLIGKLERRLRKSDRRS